MNEKIKYFLFWVLWVVILAVLSILNLVYGSGSTIIIR